VSWNSKLWGVRPEEFAIKAVRYTGGACVNPLTWRQDEIPAGPTEHLGAVGKDFGPPLRSYVQAKCSGSTLWVRLPKNENFESARDRRNYHISDYNLFYIDLLKNIA
jgi:hypothetical protein